MNDVRTKQAIAEALTGFAKDGLAQSAIGLLNTMGYDSEKRVVGGLNSPSEFANRFDPAGRFNASKGLLDQWRSVDLLFQLTADEIKTGSQLALDFGTGKKVDNTIIESYLFFAIELHDDYYTRTQLAGITRAINRTFDMPAMILFRHGQTLTLSIINRRIHKRDESKDVLEKVTLIKDIDLTNPHRAHIEILFDLSLNEVYQEYSFTNFVELQNAWQKVLDSSELNKRFFREIADWYFWAMKHVSFSKDAGDDIEVRNATSLIRLITRLIFIWFVKEKGLVPDNIFDQRNLERILNYSDPKGSTYYKAILQNLFFATLNQEMGKREFRKDHQNFMAHNLYRYKSLFKNPDDALALFHDIPFLNGGLFECLDKISGTKENPSYIRIDGFSDRADNELCAPDFLFFSGEQEVDLNDDYGTKNKRYKVRGLIDIFNRYKFTIEENTPIEEEIALDPELLGKVFENLLASYNPETRATARKQTGSYYTPREIVNYMVDESLIAYFETQLRKRVPSLEEMKDLPDLLREVFAYTEKEHPFNEEEVTALIDAIDSIKFLDPACGSAAFPMGILHKLVFILNKLDPNNERWKDKQLAKVAEIPDSTIREKAIADIEEAFERNELDYGRKLYLIEHCIYGVDIQPIAVQIAKLRFFISLVVDQKIDDAQKNRGIRPLPNLETRFVAANSLLGIEKPMKPKLRNPEIDKKEAELAEIRRNHFTARTPRTKAKYRDFDAKLRAEISQLLQRDEWFPPATAKKLAHWDPYDQNASADFFDSEWMFGITNGFDVVIANPPYVRQEQIRESKPILQNQFSCYTGLADLYVYFYERGFQLLKENGILTYISSNKYFRSGYGQKLRKFLSTESTLYQLIDFGDAPVFDAIAYPSIIILSKSQPSINQTRALKWQPGPPIEELASVFHANSFFIPQKELTSDGWRLESPVVLRLLEKLCKAGKPLDNYVNGLIFRGLTMGLNHAFVITQLQRDALIKADSKSAEYIKPYFRGRDIKRWVINYPDLYVIHVPWGFPFGARKAIAYHLQKFQEELSARPEVLEGRFPWYAMSRYGADYYHYFDAPKIVAPDIASEPRFAFDSSGSYLGNTAYIIPVKDLFLLGILNSMPITKYYTELSSQVRGGYLRFIRQYIEKIPIPSASREEKEAITSLVKRCLDSRGENCLAIEREIDERVAWLFGLTPEEIAIINQNAGG